MGEPVNCETHCNACIMRDCRVPVDGCPFVHCPNACGASMHYCKVDDHLEEVCPKALIQCINRESGCNLRVEREKLRDHLQICPASVVFCAVPCFLPNRHEEKPTVRYVEPCQGRSISPFVPPISPAPPLPECGMAPVSSGSSKHIWASPSTTWSTDPTVSNKFVEQPLTPVLCKTDGARCSCARLVPRTEANSHYRFHSDFLIPLNDSIELRCPLYRLGCQFVATRMLPHAENHQILYHPQLDRFSVRFNKNQSGPSGALPSGVSDGDTRPCGANYIEPASLNTVPTEIVCYLSQFLDDVSLFCLSQVSDRLHLMLGPLLRERMVVTPRWQRVVYSGGFRPKWEIDGFVWSLPHRTDEISEWRWSPAGAEIAAHLKSCPYNDVVVQDEPFCLTNGTRSTNMV